MAYSSGYSNVLGRFASREIHGSGIPVEVIELDSTPVKHHKSSHNRESGLRSQAKTHKKDTSDKQPYPERYEGWIKKASKVRIGSKAGKGIHHNKKE